MTSCTTKPLSFTSKWTSSASSVWRGVLLWNNGFHASSSTTPEANNKKAAETATGLTWTRSWKIEHVHAMCEHRDFLSSCARLASLTKDCLLASFYLPIDANHTADRHDWNYIVQDCVQVGPLRAMIVRFPKNLILKRLNINLARDVMIKFVPEARKWFKNRSGDSLNVSVHLQGLSGEIEFQIQPQVPLTTSICDQLGLSHDETVKLNQVQD